MAEQLRFLSDFMKKEAEMKHTKYLSLLFLPLLLCSFKSEDTKLNANKQAFDGKAYDKTEMMDFSDSTEEEIKNYYNYSEMITKKGNDLKEYLYNVISKDNYFIPYGSSTSSGVGMWYEITDRNWDISNSIDPSTFQFGNENPEDYYLVNFYFEASANYDKTKATNNTVNSTSLKAVDGATKVDYVNKTKPKGVSTDKEHLWAKNHGFKVVENSKDFFANGAPTDLHHLVAADGNTNSAGHNDNFFGEVKSKADSKTVYSYYADGTTAVSGYLGKDSNGETVFEPTDEWKGDIARSLLYMATRYNKDNGDSQTQAEPCLVFDDDGSYTDDKSGGKYDRSKFHGYHPNLATYLKWNKQDPVSKYEYHRNNLIYKNVQKNRNPFVDFPSLADWVFATTTEKEPEIASPVDDNPYAVIDFSKLESKYQLHVEDSITFSISFGSIQDLTIRYDEDYLSMSSDKKTFTAKKAGETTITYSYTDDEGKSVSYSTAIEIKDKIVLLSVKPDTGVIDHMNLVTGEEYTFELGFKNQDAFFSNEKIAYSSDDTSIISVTDDGKVTALKSGECTLYILVKSEKSEKTLLKISVKVTLSEEEQKKRQIYVIIIIVAAVLLIAVFLIFGLLIKKSGKKNSVKDYTKVYNKKSPKKKTSKGGKKNTRK